MTSNDNSNAMQHGELAARPYRSSTGWNGKQRATVVYPNSDDDDEEDEKAEQRDDGIAADEDLLADEDPDITEVDLQHSRISSIAALGLERFAGLTRLGLRQNSITSIEIPPTLKHLKEIELYDNLISHIERLDSFTNLETFDISYNKVKIIENLPPTITRLFLTQNRIKKIQNIPPEVSDLELGANRITEITGLDELTKLKDLWLGSNRLKALTGIENLKLSSLSVQSNRITSCIGLESMTTLTELYMSDNQISSLEPLRHLRLTILDIQRNPIKSLAGIEGMTDLENLWASNCEIDSFQEIERALKNKTKLEEVYFEGNPVQLVQPVLYRNKIRLALPQVLKIDATYVKIS